MIGFRNTKIIVLVISLCLILLVLIVLNLNIKQPPLTTPTPLPIPSISKTVPGKTTEEEVSSIPGFKLERSLPDGTNQYIADPPTGAVKNVILVKNGLVIFEKTVTVTVGREHPNVDEFLTKYGAPELELKGSREYGVHETYYIYASKGVVFVANPFTRELDEVQTFIPTTTEDYMSKIGDQYINTASAEPEILGP